MNARLLCAGLPADSCVIVNLYHSGTGPSKSGENSLLETLQSRPDLTFLLAALPSRYITKPYQASVTRMQAGAYLYQDIQPHVLQVFVTLAIASGQSMQEILTSLSPIQQTDTI